MTGKELKEFANRLPDECLVEMKRVDWSEKWEPLNPATIRAVIAPHIESNVLQSTD